MSDKNGEFFDEEVIVRNLNPELFLSKYAIKDRYSKKNIFLKIQMKKNSIGKKNNNTHCLTLEKFEIVHLSAMENWIVVIVLAF